MRILGIDCGTERTGFGVIDSDGAVHRVVAAGVIRTSAKDPLERRLLHIAAGLRETVREHRPQAAAVEGVFTSANVQSSLKLAHVRGIALLAVAEAGLELGEYSPAEVKTCVVGYGRAEKHQVQLMVRSLLGPECDPFLKSEDACDALAVAICHATRATLERRLRSH